MPVRFGQNFLINKSVAEKIVKAANLSMADFVLEIGPGKGILTEELAKQARKVVAVEIDKALSSLLLKKFSGKNNVEIVNKDILEISLKSYKLKAKGYKIVANLPYYITSPVIRLFLESKNPPSEMILMVQKEVAERITAKPGKMSVLAVAVQYYAQTELLFCVGKENFNPVPEVDGAVVRIKTQEHKNRRTKKQVRNFFQVIRAGFCAKRKTLANNLANSFHLDKKIVEERIKKAGLLPPVRAQELSIEDWKKLAELF